MRDRLVVLLMLLFCLGGSPALGQEWYVRVNSDDINAVSGHEESLWAVTNGGGTLLWGSFMELDKFITSQPDLYSDEEDTSATVRVWIRDDLLTNSFTSVAVGPSSTVWLGCSEGINVVDVSSGNAWEFAFTTYTVANSPLPSNLITAIEARPGTEEVWIGTQDAGLVIYDVAAGTWDLYDVSAGLASNRINCIYFDDHERAWLGTDSGVTQINMNFDAWAYLTYTTSDGLPSNFVTGVVEVPCCWVWFATNNGAARVDLNDNWDTYGTWTDGNFVSNDLRGIAPVDSELWMWTELGIIVHDLGAEAWSCFTADNTGGDLCSDDVRDLFDTGNYLIAGTQGGLCEYDGDWDCFWEEHLASNDLRAIACQDGQVWFGTYGAGANLLSGWDANNDEPGTWETFSYAPDDAIASNYINDIALDNRLDENGVWFATNLGVSYFAYGQSLWTTFDTSNTSGALPSDRVMAVALDPRGYGGGEVRTWFGTDNGLACYTAGATTHWDTFTTANSGLPSNYVTCLAGEVRGSDYYLWIGTNWGVAVLDVVNDSWTVYDKGNSGILSENVRSLLVDSDGSVWIGTTNGISILDLPSTWTSIRTSTPGSGLGSNAINAMIQGSGDLYWIATSRGLTKFDKSTMTGGRYLPTTSGLINGNVYDVCYQPCVGIWAATRGGASALRQGMPILSDESVEPPVGGPLDDYTFTIHFEDFDGFAPSAATLTVGATEYTMTLSSGTADNGYYTTTVSLAPGHWTFFFEFVDSDGCQVRHPTGLGVFDGPDIYDVFEPDNRCFDARLIWADGTPCAWHNLIPLGTDEDWFYFRAEAYIEYAVTVTAAAGASADVEIYQGDCATLVGTGDSLAPFDFVTDAGGYYFVKIADGGSTAESAGAYTLAVSGNQWPMMGHIFTRAATISAIAPHAYCDVLTYSTGPTIASGPAVDPAGNLYFGASYGRLVSLDPLFNKPPRWIFESGDSEPVMVSPALSPDGSAVYFGAQDGYLHSVNAATGLQNWDYGAGSEILSSPVVDAAGNIYFACYDGAVYSLTSAGAYRWSRSVNCSFLNSSPTLSHTGILYIGSTEGIFYAIGCADGLIDWSYDVSYPIRTTPSVDRDGNIYFGADDGNLYCLNPAGALRWTFETEGAIEGHGAFGATGRYYFGSTDGLFYALDCTATEAVVIWSRDVGSAVYGPAVDGNGSVFYGAESGWLYSSTSFGVLNWSKNVGSAITSSLAVGQDHQLFFVAGYNTVYALGCDNVDPALAFPEVSPMMGMAGDTFTYSVYYSDVNDDNPAKQYVVVDGEPIILEYQATTGRYTYAAQSTVEGSPHTYYFYFEDGYGGSTRAPETGVFYGPIVDDAPPRSQCSSPIGTNQPIIEVDFVATDEGSGVSSTRLYYAFTADGNTWPPIALAIDTGLTLVGDTGTFTFQPGDGAGYYGFYTVATDRAGLVEDPPLFYFDTITLYDPNPPVTWIDQYYIDNGPFGYGYTPFEVPWFHIEDDYSNAFDVEIYYRFNGGDWVNTGIDVYDYDPASEVLSFWFDATYGQGRYDFFIVATDEMGNAQDYESAQDQVVTAYFDVITPESHMSCDHYTRTLPLVVDFKATDDLFGLDGIRFYYRYKGDLDWTLWDDPNSADDWYLLDGYTSVTGTWMWPVPVSGGYYGEGVYSFYSCARDRAYNAEPAPQPDTDPDCSIVYDATAPRSHTSVSGFFEGGNIPVVYYASDNVSGLSEVRLFYSHGDGAFVRSTYVSSDEAGAFDFTPANGDGVYHFYTIASDLCGNVESPPITYDSTITYDTLPPTSYCYCSTSSFMVPILIYYSASDVVNDIADVTLWFRYEGGEWQDLGISMEGEGGIFEFQPLYGQGRYEFQTISTDTAGHTETFKDEADCYTELLYVKPSSRGSCDPYTSESPIVISYTTTPNAATIRLTYFYQYGDYWQDVTVATVGTPYTLEFELEDGEGRYRFMMFASDASGDEEGLKGVDCSTIYDISIPSSTCSTPEGTWRHYVDIQYTTDDTWSGVEIVALWYSYEDPEDASRNVAWLDSGQSQGEGPGAFRFVFPHGLGVYYFYTQATDRAGNMEPTPLTAKTSVRYEIGAPTSRCWVETRPFSTHVTNDKDAPIEILFEASDANGASSGIREVKLYYAYLMTPPAPIDDWTADDIEWRFTGQSVAPDNGYFHFYPNEGNGFYGFYTQAVDFAGNAQERPLLKFDVPLGVPYWDAYITYDVIAPISECSTAQGAVEDGPIAITYQADDDPFLSDSWPELDYDTTGISIVTLWYCFNGGSWTESLDPNCWGYGEQGALTFSPPLGFGAYGFCTIAEDGAGNVENLPQAPDCTVIYGPFEPQIELSATSHDFGTLSIGAVREWQLRIFNVGTGDLAVTNVYVDNPDTFSVNPTTAQIPAGQWFDVTVGFQPWQMGVTEATLTIECNDDDSRINDVSLAGAAVGPLGPTLLLRTPTRLVRPGDEIVASIGLAGIHESVEADLYIAVMLPTGEVLYYPNWSFEPTGFWLSLPAGFDLQPTEFLRLQYIEGVIPKGEYRLFAALVQPGTRFEFISSIAEAKWVLY